MVAATRRRRNLIISGLVFEPPGTCLASTLESCDRLQSPAFFASLDGSAELVVLETMEKSSVVSGTGVVHGRGLIATRDMDVGELVSIYPVHAIGLVGQDLKENNTLMVDATGRIIGDSSMLYFADDKAWFGRENGGNNFSFTAIDPSLTYTFDVNPTRDPTWLSDYFRAHMVNDASFVSTEDVKLSKNNILYYAERALEYVKDSSRAANVACSPFGPAPFMAYITTRPVKRGQEFLAIYGESYWLGDSPEGITTDAEMDAVCALLTQLSELEQERSKWMQLTLERYAKVTANFQDAFSRFYDESRCCV